MLCAVSADNAERPLLNARHFIILPGQWSHPILNNGLSAITFFEAGPDDQKELWTACRQSGRTRSIADIGALIRTYLEDGSC